ncbi:MAG: type II toxin-antitoxin system RelE/ParE family toxin [Myxococcota bacterium]|nr:type II toxin-antitoxin system RelE/ParE family toxin [Myxococcota bacterium]
MASKFRICFAEVALSDFESILEYIALNDSVASATYVHDALMARIDTLTDHPERCRLVPELKEMGLSQFRELIWKPYRVCFSIHKQEVAIVAVLDGRRDLEQLLIDRAFRRD